MYTKIKDTLLIYRKTGAAKEAKTLTFILGEIDRAGKDRSDKAVEEVLQRVVKQLKKSPVVDEKEIMLLESFLAPKLTGESLEGFIYKIIVDLGSSLPAKAMLGKVMKQLAQQRQYTFDGAEATAIIRKLLGE